jgi:hypothetical protein
MNNAEFLVEKNKLLTDQNELLKSLLDNCMKIRELTCDGHSSSNANFSKIAVANGRPFKRATDAKNPAGSSKNILDNAIEELIERDKPRIK